MKTSILAIILIFFAGSILATAKDDKKKEVVNATGPVEGVVYSLPQTGIRVHVKATCETTVNGPFYLYAQKMLGIENAPTSGSTKWTMTDMKIETFNEPDPNQVHKAIGETAQLVSLTEKGVLAGVNLKTDFKESEIQTQTFLSGKTDKQVKFTDLSIWSFYSPADSTRSFKVVSKTLEQKAAEAAETIFNLRSSRFALLTNADDEPLPDGKSFEIMTEELGKMEKNYLALFIGKSSKKDYEFSFEFIPEQKSPRGEVFFRFSEERGVLPKTDLSGRPILIEVIKSEILAATQTELSTSANPEAGKSGLYYRMPGMAEIRIMDGSTQLAGARSAIAQFGTTATVPENLLDGNYKLEFYPNTGAVKSIIKDKSIEKKEN